MPAQPINAPNDPVDTRAEVMEPDVDFAKARLLEALAAHQGWPFTIKGADDLRYLHANGAWAHYVDRSVDQLRGAADSELFESAHAALLRSADQTALARPGVLVSEHRIDHRGERRDWTAMRLVVTAGARRLLCTLWQDHSAQRQRDAALRTALEQLEQHQKANLALRRELGDQSLRDQATGLASSAHFEDQMRREVDLSTREHREFALVYMEIDPPSEPLRALGERAFERVHEAMGRLLRGNTRAMDASCRIDDRRFAVLLSGVGLATAHSRMEGLRRQCATQIIAIDGREFGFTVSVGVASFPHTAQTQEGVIAACEAALAQARRRGGNSVALASIRFSSG